MCSSSSYIFPIFNVVNSVLRKVMHVFVVLCSHKRKLLIIPDTVVMTTKNWNVMIIRAFSVTKMFQAEKTSLHYLVVQTGTFVISLKDTFLLKGFHDLENLQAVGMQRLYNIIKL